MWEYRAGQGGVLGGIEWGAAVDGDERLLCGVRHPAAEAGGLHAVRLATAGSARGSRRRQRRSVAPAAACNGAQSAAVTAIPGVVFSGSNDGALRAYDANRRGGVGVRHNKDFTTVNGVAARGASLIGPGPVVAGGMVYVNSGYGAFGGRPGNVLLAFGVE